MYRAVFKGATPLPPRYLSIIIKIKNMEKEKEEKKIFVGMFRPPWEKISTGGGYIQCSCGQILQTQEATREHWQLGHFDSPIYKTLNP